MISRSPHLDGPSIAHNTLRLIVNDLRTNVVQQFCRQIKIMEKLHTVAKIISNDCEDIDTMMTKYSQYEHSQSGEDSIEDTQGT